MDKYIKIKTLFEKNADEDRAESMAHYMRDQFCFYGLSSPKRKTLYKDFLKEEKKRRTIDWELLDRCYADMHREFCLPYDRIQHKAIHEAGSKVVYHLCGGVMPLLETVVENGADALETMTPASMGGDCIMEEAAQRVGDKLAFIGGFDQNEGFERGNKEFIHREVQRLFKANPNGGYRLYLFSIRSFLFWRSRKFKGVRAGMQRI